MEHPADIRHRAGMLSSQSWADDEGFTHSGADPDDVKWAMDTIVELLDELERRPAK
jgi:hypothetical protein